MLHEPVRAGRAGTDCATNEYSRGTTGESADQHSRAGSYSQFDLVAAIVTRSLEHALFIHIGAGNVGVYQDRIEHETLPIGHDEVLRQDADGRLARDSARFVELGDSSFAHRTRRDDSLTVNHDRI